LGGKAHWEGGGKKAIRRCFEKSSTFDLEGTTAVREKMEESFKN